MDTNKISDDIQLILDSISDGLFTVDNNYLITFFNKAAEKITGIPRKDALGRRCCDVFKANICENECALKSTIKTSKAIINKTVWIITLDGTKMPISISTAVLKDKSGKFIGGVETFRDLTQIEKLKKELQEKYTINDIVSKNNHIRKIFEILPEIAESNSNVLIEGPNGSGKELFAKAIHNISTRQKSPFIAVNLSALPDNLLESELFGYKKGAFTGAVKDKTGRLALAEKGTLFLDEIGEISPAFQVKLLRVIQEKEYEPLGGTATEKANVRFIFATNRNLEELIKKGEFREDLYYRINVVKIKIPSLKKRLEDIPLLINHFITLYNKINNKTITGMENDALSLLMHYDFPGNVRELKNIIEHAFILCKHDMIQIKHLPEYLIKDINTIISKKSMTLEDMEKEMIMDALKRNKNKKEISAKELGIDYTTLWRKMNKYGIKNVK